jgi:hypothetical protein
VARMVATLKQIPVTILSSTRAKLAVSFIVPETEMQRSVEMLHREFFKQIDPVVFAECQSQGVENAQPASTFAEPGASAVMTSRRFRPLTTVCQN